MRRDQEYLGRSVMEMELPGKRKRGRPKRKFLDVVKEDWCDEKDIENSSVQFSRFLFPPLVEQNTYINVISPRKKGHATKRNNVVTCKNSINYTSKGNGLHDCIT